MDAELLVDRKTPLRLKSIAWCSMPTVRSGAAQRALCFESALTGRLLNLQEEQRFGLAYGEAAQNINHGLGSIVREVLNCASGEIKDCI